MNCKHLIITFALSSLFACQFDQSSSGKNDSFQTTSNEVNIPDSLLFERYNEYTSSNNFTKYVDRYHNYVASLEKNRDTIKLQNFLDTNLGLISNNDSEWPYSSQDVIPYLFEIDVNGDGVKDIIYDGHTVGEGNITKIMINNSGTFKKVFEIRQNVTKMVFKDGKMAKIYISNPGCCADAHVVDYEYNVSYSDNTSPVFTLKNSVGYTKSYQKPGRNYQIPRSFNITKKQASLRDCCFEFDKEHPRYGDKDNMIAIYPKNSKGLAIGEKKENGVVWLFVLMNKDNAIIETQFELFTEQPTQVYGWVKKDNTDLN